MVALSQTRNSGDRIIKFSWIESRPGNVCNHTPTSRDGNLLVSPHSVHQRAASGPCLLKGELNGLENLVILHQVVSYHTSVCTILPGFQLSKCSSPIRQGSCCSEDANKMREGAATSHLFPSATPLHTSPTLLRNSRFSSVTQPTNHPEPDPHNGILWPERIVVRIPPPPRTQCKVWGTCENLCSLSTFLTII